MKTIPANFRREYIKIRNVNSTICNSIDDVYGDVDIANLFSNKYLLLCNSVALEQSAFDNLLESNENDISQHCFNKDDPVFILMLITNLVYITYSTLSFIIYLYC